MNQRLMMAVMAVLTSADGIASGQFEPLGDLVPAQVDAFKFTISLAARRDATRALGIVTQRSVLRFVGRSAAEAAAGLHPRGVQVSVTSRFGMIDVAAVAESGSATADYGDDSPRPAKSFQFELTSLCIPPDGEVPIRFRFKDATVSLVLRYDEGKGLRLQAADSPYVTIGSGNVPDFVNIRNRDGEFTWQCNPLSMSCCKLNELRWLTDIPMHGQPKRLKVLDDLLFLQTSDEHGCYVRKEDGKLLLYDRSHLVGQDPVNEIVSLWQREMTTTWGNENDGQKERGHLTRFITAAVLLDDERFIPCLIDSVGKGRGLGEALLAISALERFHGDAKAWIEPGSGGPIFTERIDPNRVGNSQQRQAEQQKWRRIFGIDAHEVPAQDAPSNVDRQALPPWIQSVAAKITIDPWNPDSFAVSPDGTSVAFVSNAAVWITDTQIGPPRKLADLPVRATGSATLFSLAWTPSQDGVVFGLHEPAEPHARVVVHRVIHVSTDGVATNLATITRELGTDPCFFRRVHVTQDRKSVVATESFPLIWDFAMNQPRATCYDYLIPSTNSDRFLGVEIDTGQLVVTDQSFAVNKRYDATFDGRGEIDLIWSPDESFVLHRMEAEWSSVPLWMRVDLHAESRRRLPGRDKYTFTGRGGELLQVTYGTPGILRLSFVPEGDAPLKKVFENKPPDTVETPGRCPPLRHNRDFTLFAVPVPDQGVPPGYQYHVVDQHSNLWPLAGENELLASYQLLAFTNDDQSILAYGESQLISIPLRNIMDRRESKE